MQMLKEKYDFFVYRLPDCNKTKTRIARLQEALDCKKAGPSCRTVGR